MTPPSPSTSENPMASPMRKRAKCAWVTRATGELPVEELLRSVPFRLAFDRGAIEAPGVDQDDLRRALDLGALDGGRSIALYLYGVP